VSAKPNWRRQAKGLASTPRQLSELEKRQRTDFYADNPRVQATAVEPGNLRDRRSNGGVSIDADTGEVI
jgi:hypothetical protein